MGFDYTNEEDNLSWLSPDILTPSQYTDMVKNSQTPGELQMLFAILHDSFTDYRVVVDRRNEASASAHFGLPASTRISTNALRKHLEAAEWFFDDDPEHNGICSIRTICDVFNINLKTLRRVLISGALGHMKRRSPVMG